MLEYLLSFLILTGATLTFIGSLGLLRLKDFYMRLHGPTKATTLGVGSLLIASALFFSSHNAGISLHEALITVFLVITAPVSAHLLAKAALHLNLHSFAKMPAKSTKGEDGADDDAMDTQTPEEKSSSSDTHVPRKPV